MWHDNKQGWWKWSNSAVKVKSWLILYRWLKKVLEFFEEGVFCAFNFFEEDIFSSYIQIKYHLLVKVFPAWNDHSRTRVDDVHDIMASCQKWGIMRSFLNLQNLVIVSSLAFGLFTIRILAMDGLDSPDEDSSNDVDFPICNKKIIPGRELLLVSTLDGKLSAIDPKHGGSLWSVATGKILPFSDVV